jgi:hypothetical protein
MVLAAVVIAVLTGTLLICVATGTLCPDSSVTLQSFTSFVFSNYHLKSGRQRLSPSRSTPLFLYI